MLVRERNIRVISLTFPILDFRRRRRTANRKGYVGAEGCLGGKRSKASWRMMRGENWNKEAEKLDDRWSKNRTRNASRERGRVSGQDTGKR